MEPSKIIVDTDVIIDYLKKRQPGAGLLKRAYLNHRIHVTSVTIYELFYGAQKNGKTALIDKLLQFVTVLQLDETAARKAAAIHYSLKSTGMDIGVKDSFIAGIIVIFDYPSYRHCKSNIKNKR